MRELPCLPLPRLACQAGVFGCFWCCLALPAWRAWCFGVFGGAGGLCFDRSPPTPYIHTCVQVGNEATVLGFVGLPYTLATYLVEGKSSKVSPGSTQAAGRSVLTGALLGIWRARLSPHSSHLNPPSPPHVRTNHHHHHTRGPKNQKNNRSTWRSRR